MMKNINNKFIRACALVGLLFIASCEDDTDLRVNETATAPQLLTPIDNTSIELKEAEKDQEALSITWEAADYGQSLQVDYVVQLAEPATDFAEPIVIGNVNETTHSLTVEQLNGFSIAAGLKPFQEGTLELRVLSTIGDQNTLEVISQIMELKITPYTPKLPSLAVPGNHQGWDPTIAPLISAEAGKTNYEGYVWLDGPFKFVAPDGDGNFAWGNVDYGDDGTGMDILVADEEVNVEAAVAGQYFVEVDTNKLTYSITKYDWGIIGDATPGGWTSDEDMAYNATNGTWELTTNLTAGQLKFRANDDWVWSYGDTEADGVLEVTDTNIAISEAGNYTIIMDLSSPRSYTYTITKN